MVRPRYEVTRAARTRIAHLNVQRADLQPDPGIAKLDPRFFGRGYLLPFPVPDPARYRTLVVPAPMTESLTSLPVRVDCFDRRGQGGATQFMGNLGRDHASMLDVGTLAGGAGHAELVYDFRDGGQADGWLHALIRYEDRASGHVAETSFGAHIFNTAMTYRGATILCRAATGAFHKVVPDGSTARTLQFLHADLSGIGAVACGVRYAAFAPCGTRRSHGGGTPRHSPVRLLRNLAA